jgi:hypothetical protein
MKKKYILNQYINVYHFYNIFVELKQKRGLNEYVNIYEILTWIFNESIDWYICHCLCSLWR